MRKVFLILLVSLMAISLVLAAQGETGQQGTGNGSQTSTGTQTQNQGVETHLQNQVKVQSGLYINSNGEQMQIQNENQFRLQTGGAEATSDIEISSEYDSVQNRTRLRTQLSNGNNAEIKIMPNTASQIAIQRLQLKVCNSDNNCSIEIKEVGSGEQVRVAYDVQARKEAKVLGMFRTRMRIQTQIDAETGEVIQVKKPWWAFLATTE